MYTGRESNLSSNPKVNHFNVLSAWHHPRSGSWAGHFKSGGPHFPRGLIRGNDFQIRSRGTLPPVAMFVKLKAASLAERKGRSAGINGGHDEAQFRE